MHDYTRLQIWHAARSNASTIYEITSHFPESERYGLQAQMRRAAVSIASNIAEGSARGSQKDFARFLDMASGSAAELETRLIIASDIGLLGGTQCGSTVGDLRTLRGKIRALRNRRYEA